MREADMGHRAESGFELPVVAGPDEVEPGLAERLQGISLSATDLPVKYQLPEDLPQRDLAGQSVDLRITVKDAREKKQRALDDDFAKDTGEAETLEGLKEKIRERLADADKKRIDGELRGQLLKEIVARNEFPIAPALIDRYAGSMVNLSRSQSREQPITRSCSRMRLP